MVQRRRLGKMIKKILVPLDGSRFSLRALSYAGEIAPCFDAEVMLLQVIQSAVAVPTTAGMVPGMESVAVAEIASQIALEQDNKSAARVRRYLSRKVRNFKSRGIRSSYHVAVGDAAQSIMRFSRKEHVDLVVMTTHGKGGLQRAFMGSVADSVIRESGTPVLVIRPKTRKKHKS